MAEDREVIYHFEPGKGWIPRLPPKPGDYINVDMNRDWQEWYRMRRLYGR